MVFLGYGSGYRINQRCSNGYQQRNNEYYLHSQRLHIAYYGDGRHYSYRYGHTFHLFPRLNDTYGFSGGRNLDIFSDVCGYRHIGRISNGRIRGHYHYQLQYRHLLTQCAV